MRKSDFLKLFDNIPDDAEIVIEVDGGDYWGMYIDQPEIAIKDTQFYSDGHPMGHPGATGKIQPPVKGILAVIRKK